MYEVTGPVIAIVLTLCAVFVPIAFLVALTLTPSLCVLILKREHHQPGRFFQWFNRFFLRVTSRYTDGVAWMLRRGALAALLFIGMVAITAGLWRVTPGSLVP